MTDAFDVDPPGLAGIRRVALTVLVVSLGVVLASAAFGTTKVAGVEIPAIVAIIAAAATAIPPVLILVWTRGRGSSGPVIFVEGRDVVLAAHAGPALRVPFDDVIDVGPVTETSGTVHRVAFGEKMFTVTSRHAVAPGVREIPVGQRFVADDLHVVRETVAAWVARGRTTAADLRRELEAGPAFVARRSERGAHRQERESELRDAQAPLVRELQAAGQPVESVWDLVNASEPYPEVLPILLRHLGRDYPDRVREGIARALAVPGDAMFAWDELRALYQQEPVHTHAKDGLAVALAAVADDTTMGEVIELLRDERHGESRVFFVGPVSRSGHARSSAALEDLSDDPHLHREIARWCLRRPDADRGT